MLIELKAELDPNNPVHLGFLKWYETATPVEIGKALAVGCSVVNNALSEERSVEASRIQRELSEKLDKAREDTECRLESLKRLHSDNVRSIKEAHEALIVEKTRQHQSEITSYIERSHKQVEQWISKYEEATKQYNEYVKGELDGSKEREISELKARLSVVESSNAYKGTIGELTIRDVLARRFPSHEIRDTSAMNAMSDIHIVDEMGYTVVIESKNKATVTAQDVAKSTNDIKHVSAKIGDRFVGYLFVSLRSGNIPRKGELCYELIEGKPCIWYGCSNRNMLEDDIAKLVTLLWQHRSWHSDVKKDEVTPKINSYMLKVSELKKSIESLNGSLASMKTQVVSMQGTVSWIYDDMCDLVGRVPTTLHACCHCGATYKRKGDLDRHIVSKHPA